MPVVPIKNTILMLLPKLITSPLQKNMFCKFFNFVNRPSSVKRLNSNIICGFNGLGIRSAPNIAHDPKEQSFQILPEKITTRGLSANLRDKSALGVSFRCFATASSNDQVESKNNQIFISFRGETRAGFTGHLYKTLTLAGYRTFIDNSMRRGLNIEKELIKAIRNSEVSVVVISKGYAGSRTCLDELVEILHCRKRFGHKVLPIFYHVDPDEIYYQNATFGAVFEGLVKHLEGATNRRVSRWKEALKEVAGISGLVLREFE